MNTFLKFFSKKYTILALLATTLLVATFAGIFIGSVSLSPIQIIKALFNGDTQNADFRIVVYVRLPRVLGALLAGGALAMAGALLQSVLDNSLASPNIVGVNAGSGLFSLVATIILPSSLIATAFGAFLGALVAVVFVLVIATKTGSAKNSIILAGVAISSLFTAVIDTIITINPDLQLDRVAFTVGGFSGVTYQILLCVLPFFIIGAVLSMLISYDLNVLSLGDETAQGLGVRVKAVRIVAVLAVAFLAGSAIAVAGLLGFVGLIAPHAVAKMVGKDNRMLLPASALFGALLTLVCDIIARTAFSPFELPVGIILSFIGVPFFLFLLLKNKKNIGRKRK